MQWHNAFCATNHFALLETSHDNLTQPTAIPGASGQIAEAHHLRIADTHLRIADTHLQLDESRTHDTHLP